MAQQPVIVLATAEQIREIAERAFRIFFDEPSDDDEELYDTEVEQGLGRRQRTMWERMSASREALRFCCAAAALLRDPQLIDIPVRALEVAERSDDYPTTARTIASDALTKLLRAGAPITADIIELATSEVAELREAVADGLVPRGPVETQWLETLAGDANSSVRNAAKKSLGDSLKVLWWTGKFDSDPLARMSEEQGLACKDAIERLAVLLAEPPHKQANASEEIAACARQLPAPLALEVVGRCILALPAGWVKDSALGPCLLQSPGRLAILETILLEWMRTTSGMVFATVTVAAWGAACSQEVREGLRVELLSFLKTPPHYELSGLAEYHSPIKSYCALLVAVWPPELDASPLIDLLVGDSDSENVPSRLPVSELLGDKLTYPSALERIADARVAGYPGRWERVAHSCTAILLRLQNAELRPIADRAALSEDKKTTIWAWELLLNRLLDPERDGTRQEVLAKLCADPAHLAVVRSSSELTLMALGVLRPMLSSGQLDFKTASLLLNRIDDCWGGVIGPMSWSVISSRLRHPRSPVPDGLPSQWQGPPTQDEWAILRRLRDAALAAAEPEAHSTALNTLPAGPWAPEDQPLLDELLRGWEQRLPHAEIELAYILASKPSPDAPEILLRIIDASDRDDRSLLRRCWRASRRALGLAIEKPDATAGGADESEDDDWGDDPDED